MNLAFSTLGMPGAPPEQVRALALSTGWTGIEVLSSDDEPIHTGLDQRTRQTVREILRRDVTLLSINSYIHVGRSDRTDAQVVADTISEAQLAADVGASALRVFPGADGEGGDVRIIRRLKKAARLIPAGVEIWLETHDSHSTGAAVSGLLDRIADKRVRAIWDVAHPMNEGEHWQTTLTLLRPHLAHVQIKDEAEDDSRTPVLLGAGSLPVADILNHLLADGYQQWVSLEWERKWYPDVVSLEDALIQGRAWLQEILHTSP